MTGAFTVAAIMREPLPVLTRFLNWYRAQGAGRMILFLDDPDDPALPYLRTIPEVDARPCDAAFWTRLGLPPGARFTRRQNAALTLAYHETSEGWFLNVDADELMRFEGRTIAEALATWPDELQTARILSAEQVFLADGTEAFRLPLPRPTINEIYGAHADLFRSRFGLIGHPEGKSFYRAGLPGIRLRQHWAHEADGARIHGEILRHEDGAHLLHFAAPDYDTWRRKLDWRRGSHGFTDPMKDALERISDSQTEREEGYRALYQAIHTLTPEQEAQLDAKGGLLRLGDEIPPLG
ncbi:glycosyltransferase family 2 protein [Boseongicola sp. H5]|uniref:glycosyltransferase family 2 protein n=1 Tax=Boseongicola sp. H5 TaxID=2763261 RepID=UPI001D0B10CB|nr:glycosyltransferase family 2 protein [Boseongicola sp. H5]